MGVVTGHLPEVERPMAFVKALVDLQKACGVDGLKMSDYGITKEDMAKCAANARHTMGGLFELDPYALSLEETTQIMVAAYKKVDGTHKKSAGHTALFLCPCGRRTSEPMAFTGSRFHGTR